MAKKKTTPAQRFLRYELTNSSSVNTERSRFVDLARDLSRVNRRLYRQGRCYYVKKITVVSRNTPNVGDVTDPSSGATLNQGGRVSVSTVPNTWVSRNAWKRGFRLWNKMQKDAMAEGTNDIRATWHDFKVYMTDGTQSILNPIDNGGNTYAAGEWDLSTFVTPDGTTSSEEFFATMLGNHVGAAGSRVSVGLIKSYGESRRTVNSPDPNVQPDVYDDPLLNVFDYGTQIDEVLELAVEENDTPPYDINAYPGDNANGPKPAVVQDCTLRDGMAIMGGFEAVCGLLEFEASSPVANDVYSITVELAMGDYRGIKAEVI